MTPPVAEPARQIKTVCPYCGVGCGMVLHVEDGRVARVSGDPDHPASFGSLCSKGSTVHQTIRTPDRLAHAQRRRIGWHPPGQDGLFERVPFDVATQEVADRLRGIIERHGPDAVALYVSGQLSTEAQYVANKLAKGFLRTNNIDSNSRLCMASAATGYKSSLGADGPPGHYEDFDHADTFLVIGSNMADCHPILYQRMKRRMRESGARLIVVDPRRTATAVGATLYLPLRPGTDLALLNGWLHLLVKLGRVDEAFIARHTDGWDAMREIIDAYPPARVSELTGLPVNDIVAGAKILTESPRWMSLWTMGLNQSARGTWNINALCNLHLATGQICQPGNGPFSLTGQPNAMGGREVGYMSGGLPGQRSVQLPKDRADVERIWNVPPGTIRPRSGPPAIELFHAIERGAIKAVWIIGSNPVVTLPNRDRVRQALERAEFVVVQDAYHPTETSRFAHILLPGAVWAEGEGTMTNSSRMVTYMPRAVAPPGDARPDWEIICEVARRMGYERGFPYRSAAEIFTELRACGNERTGYDLRGISYSRLSTEGALTWPLAPAAGDRAVLRRYVTPDGRVHFPTETGKARFWARPYLPNAELPDEDFPFVLLTGRVPHQWHTRTKTGQVPSLNKLNPGPYLEINAADAAALGVSEGTPLRVTSRRGTLTLPARPTGDIQPGCCWAPMHWNDSFAPGVSVNAVTSEIACPESRQPELKYCPVHLAVAPQPAPNPIADPTPTPVPPETLPIAMTSASSSRVPYIPESAPFSEEQRQWLNGFFAGMFSSGPANGAPATVDNGHVTPALGAPPVPLLVLFGSQTGNAEGLSKKLKADAEKRGGFAPRMLDMAQYDAATLPNESNLLIVTSTWGEGDPPDNAAGFMEKLLAEDHPRLEKLRYSVLALGDRNYEDFCGCGKKFDARLEALGARRIHPRQDCDTDYDAPAKEWADAVLTLLKADAADEKKETPVPAIGHHDEGSHMDPGAADLVAAGQPVRSQLVPTQPSNVAPAPASGTSAAAYSRTNPFPAKLLASRKLTLDGSEKDTRHYEIGLQGSGLQYEVGDALGLLPTNSPELTQDILTALGFDGEEEVLGSDGLKKPIRFALLRDYQIRTPHKEFLTALSQRDESDAFLRDLLDPNVRTELDQYLYGREIIDFLLASPKLGFTPDEFVKLLRKQQPRLYSIASSLKAHPEQVHLTVDTLRYDAHGRKRHGVSSTFLADRVSDSTALPVFIQTAKHFRLPEDRTKPVIMVGPGTGIAPFRAFLQERHATGATGGNWLFFGAQKSATDFFYQEELTALQQSGCLTRLDLAFSRDQAEKIYVQTRMQQNAAELWRWLEEGAHFYVCGDAKRMAKDVDDTLHAAIRESGGLSEDNAKEYVAAMKKNKRYQRDVY